MGQAYRRSLPIVLPPTMCLEEPTGGDIASTVDGQEAKGAIRK